MHPYFPMSNNSWIDYHVYKVTGYWHDSVMALDVLTRVISPVNSFQRVTCIKSGDCVGRVHGPGGVVQTSILTNATLYQDRSTLGVGEIGGAITGDVCVQEPPLLICPDNTTPGYDVTVSTRVTKQDNVTKKLLTYTFPCRTRVFSKGPWGPWADTFRVGFKENVGHNNNLVYNYVFAKNIGLVNYWYGQIDLNNNVAEGYELIAAAWSI